MTSSEEPQQHKIQLLSLLIEWACTEWEQNITSRKILEWDFEVECIISDNYAINHLFGGTKSS